jgi:predicted component of type VI protein secretion system
VQSAEIVMPDGLIYYYDEGEETSVSIEYDLSSKKKELSNQAAFIQLIIPERVPNVSPLLGAIPRFNSVEGADVKDENTGDNPISIANLIPNFSLYIGDCPPPKHIGFPIAKVKFEDNAFKLIGFTPPCFFLAPKALLIQKCSLMVKNIREKAHAFSEKWQNQVGSNLLRETADILRPLMTVLPMFEVLVSSRQISPAMLFYELVRGAGIISQLTLSRIPDKFKSYNHNGIDECIEPVIDYITECIERISLDYTILPFVKNDKFFSLKVHPSYIHKEELLVGVRAKQGVSFKDIEDWMSEAVIVSDNAIQQVKERRILGATRGIINDERLYTISPPRDTTMFYIKADKTFVAPNQYFHIFNQSDEEQNRPMNIVLYVPKYPENAVKAA